MPTPETGTDIRKLTKKMLPPEFHSLRDQARLRNEPVLVPDWLLEDPTQPQNCPSNTEANRLPDEMPAWLTEPIIIPHDGKDTPKTLFPTELTEEQIERRRDACYRLYAASKLTADEDTESLLNIHATGKDPSGWPIPEWLDSALYEDYLAAVAGGTFNAEILLQERIQHLARKANVQEHMKAVTGQPQSIDLLCLRDTQKKQ